MSESPSPSTETPSHPSSRPSRKILGILVGIGAASAVWALFLWWQLLRSRAGFEPVCLGGSGGCTDLWSSGFASWIHAYTGLPVAAWGAVWGAVAAILPLQALGREEGEKGLPWVSALRFVGLAGLLGVAALVAVSVAAGNFCGSCAVTYGLSVIYGVLALRLPGPRWTPGGLATAAVAVLVAWGLFLYPGVRTPKNVLAESRQAFEEAAGTRVPDPVHTEKSVVPDDNPLKVNTWPLSEEERARRLKEQLSAAPPQWLGALSAILERHRQSPAPPADAPEPRHLVGSADADHRLTIFTDTECGHCAQLHAALEVLPQLFPEGAVQVDSRHFPLDGRCNPNLRPNLERSGCAAAKARICIEDLPGAWDLETELYRRQADLDEEVIFEVLAPAMERSALEACMAAPETERALAEDVEFAMNYDPHGTPVVLFDGRTWTQDPMMIYILLLAGGDVERPEFENLPPPPEDLHLH